jgi:REP element-mobilizing transposase RayT
VNRLYNDQVTVTRKVRQYSGGVYDLGLHVVWCPKYRRRVLGGRVVRPRELIEQKATEKGWEIIALEVMPDHVHLFVKHEPNASVPPAIRLPRSRRCCGITVRSTTGRCRNVATLTGMFRRRASSRATSPPS